MRDGAWGWGAVFLDFDNDGDLDLAMTNGLDVEHTTIDDAFNDDPMRVWENDGTGVMTEVAEAVGVDDSGSGKGLVTFDYDDDGDLDLFVVNNASEPRLYRNDAPRRNRWLRLRVEGVETNRDSIGARVTVWPRRDSAPQVREVGVASHFLGQSEPVLHFGLGPGHRRVHRVRVEFPASGRTIERRWLRANRTYRVREDARRCGRLGGETALALVPLLWPGRRRSGS